MPETAKILVVDDDADTRDLLGTFLGSRGYDVLTASNGNEVLEAVNRDPQIDIVLLDIFIPMVGGMEVLRQIQTLTDAPTVILVTALADREIARDALRLG